jgi:hypothetical protein
LDSKPDVKDAEEARWRLHSSLPFVFPKLRKFGLVDDESCVVVVVVVVMMTVVVTVIDHMKHLTRTWVGLFTGAPFHKTKDPPKDRDTLTFVPRNAEPIIVVLPSHTMEEREFRSSAVVVTVIPSAGGTRR